MTVNNILDYDMAFIAEDGESYSFVKQAERKTELMILFLNILMMKRKFSISTIRVKNLELRT